MKNKLLLGLFVLLGLPEAPVSAHELIHKNNNLLHPRLALGGSLERPLDTTVPRSPLLLMQATHELDERERGQLEKLGVEFSKRGNRLSQIGVSYSVRIDPRQLQDLAQTGLIEVLAPAWPQMIHPSAPWQGPTEFNHALEYNGTLAARVLRNPEGERLTGEGQVICLIDSGIDPFHPLFFHADGGATAWFDATNDGSMTPGVDGVDWNNDGILSPDEVLQVTGGILHDTYTGEPLDWEEFKLNRQWLYLDLNQNGKRDQGEKKGFTDETPGFGEPIFLAEDLNRDGKLEHGEKLLLLGTSKIRLFRDTASGNVYERGVNLSSTMVNEAFGHGTGSGGLMVGGAAGLTAITGIAPSAELIVIGRYGFTEEGEDTFINSLLDCSEAGAQTFVHEYGGGIGEFGDGGGPYEAILDTLHEQGHSQVTATHNYASYPNHAILTLEPGEVRTLDVTITHYPGYTIDSALFLVSTRWRQGSAEDLSLMVNTSDFSFEFNSTQEVFGIGQGGQQQGEYIADSMLVTSPRGTHLRYGVIYREDYQPVGLSAVEIKVTNQGTETMELWIDLADDNAYSPGIYIDGDATTQAGTMAHPSTADSAISVGAHGCNLHDASMNEVPYGLKVFSGRGPRIDGFTGVDIVAPEDHFSAANNTLWDTIDPGSYIRFAGTSGALPNVGGAVALLREADPSLTTDQLKERIQTFARADGNTGAVPNTDWGFGKLDVYKTIATLPAPPLNPPIAVWTIEGESYAGETTVLDAKGSSDEEPGFLTYRWDIGNIGTWTGSFLDEATFETIVETPGNQWVRLEVEDADGLWSISLAQLTTIDAPEIIEEEEEEEEEVFEPEEREITPQPTEIETPISPEEEFSYDDDDDEFLEEDEPFTSPLNTSTGCQQDQQKTPASWGLLLLGWVALLALRRWKGKNHPVG